MGYDKRKVFLRETLRPINVRTKIRTCPLSLSCYSLLTTHFLLFSEGFIGFFTLAAAFDDPLKKAYDIRQVKPKSTIDTPGIKPTWRSRILPFNHHGALASHTFHGWTFNLFISSIPFTVGQLGTNSDKNTIAPHRGRFKITATRPKLPYKVRTITSMRP